MMTSLRVLEDQLNAWAATNDAEGTLPELVRRLLLATASLRSIEMPAGKGTKSPGFDGQVIADRGGLYCPSGKSVWEISVEAATTKKLNGDYNKRVAELRANGLSSVPWTYVAVTARISRKGEKSGKTTSTRAAADPAGPKLKASWVEEKRRDRFFQDVRLLDATDLATWLSQAPVVEQWFLQTILHQSSEHISDLGRTLRDFSRRTHPPLPSKILLEGQARERAREQIYLFMGQKPRHLLVEGPSRDEAGHFVAAALSTIPNELERTTWENRTLVVWNADALQQMQPSAAQHDLLLIANFDDVPLERLHKEVRIILPVNPGHGSRDALRLQDVPWAKFAEVLQAIGMREPEATRIAGESRGSLAALQHRLGYVERPRWVQEADMTHLAALLLVGAWQPDNPVHDDRTIMQQLTGDADETERVCERLQRSPQRPMTKDTGRGFAAWTWTSRPHAWDILIQQIPATVLRNFEDVACQVLGTDDLIYTVPRDERLIAAARLSVPRASEALREGLAEGLARLGQADEHLREVHGASRGSNLAAKVLWTIFDGNRGNEATRWHRWASLSAELPYLAQSAPDVFLRILKTQLVDGAGRLFAEEVTMGRSPHVGLLWAIEKLAWDSGRLGDCALCLARLHELDRQHAKPGRLVNRALESLAALFYPFRTQTNADPATCESVLRQIVKLAVPSIALDLLERILGQTSGMLQTNATPDIIPFDKRSDEEWDARVEAEYVIRLRAVEQLALEVAGTDVVAWVRFLNVADQNTEPVLLAALEQNADIVDVNQALWTFFRRKLHILASEEVTSKFAAERARFEPLYARFEPLDLVDKYAWLFAPNVDLPDIFDWKRAQIAIVERRQLALQELWAEPNERAESLVRLAQKATAPGFLGEALARTSFADEVEALLFAQSDVFAAVLPWFLSTRIGTDRQRLLDRIKSLIAAGQTDLALKVLYLQTPDKGLWDAITTLGESFSRRYWSEMRQLWGKHDGPASSFAIDALLAAGNDKIAVDTFLHAVCELDGQHLLEYLERFFSDVDLLRALLAGPSAGYWIAEALEKLDADTTLPPERVASVEFNVAFGYLEFVTVGRKSPRMLRLSDAFAQNTAMFVDLLRCMFRAEGEPKPSTDEPDYAQREQRAKAAFGFLWDWRGFPGDGRAVDEANGILETWARDVLRAAKKAGYGRVAPSEVAKVLARGPLGPDRIWPCEAARKLLEEDVDGELRVGLATARRNARGTYGKSIGEGGIQERGKADRFRRDADTVREEWPATARLLETLADGYDRDAQHEDDRGATDRRQYGLDEVSPPASKTPPETKRENSPLPKSVPPSQTRPDGPLTRLRLRDFGPAPRLDMKLAPRLNLLTGDNSLGKTFVLEVLWWVLTGSWSGHPAKPEVKRTKAGKVAKSKAAILANAGSHELEGTYNALHERWSTQDVASLAPGLVIYARVDGGFSVWDPIRNVVPMAKGELDLSAGYHFSPADLWQRLMADDGTTVLCRGLLDDLVSWKSDTERQDAYTLMETVLARISPENAPIKLGKPERFHIRDARDIPTLEWPYGRIFVEHASAAVKRMLGFAYILVWAVTELRRAAPLAELDPLRHVTFLIDEIEAHLHPKWQRSIMSRLLQLANDISPSAKVQFVVTTHAPLVLVSIEQLVNEADDALFDFDLEPAGNNAGTVQKVSVVEREPWEIHGDVNAWLASEIFNHTQLRSPEAERAMDKASLMLEETQPDKRRGQQVLQELVTTLGPKDPYLLRFRYLAEKKGWLS